jgi:hypothetical protein
LMSIRSNYTHWSSFEQVLIGDTAGA